MHDLLNRLCVLLARRLSPELARQADGYRYLLTDLDEARWWLSVHANEPACLAQFILDRDADRWERPRGHGLGLPPSYVTNISAFREWLGSKPFAPPVRSQEDGE